MMNGASDTHGRKPSRRYVLLTPARNEAAFIEQALQSVVNQTERPLRWIIIDDASTDRTAEIVSAWAADHDFIELVQVDGDSRRNFGSKAKALAAGYERVADLSFGYVGNLDADVSFDPDYYGAILDRFEANPRLGIAGGVQYDWTDGEWRFLQQSVNSVAGPFQLFHRSCYDDIGGYLALPYGGVDAAAEFAARAKGWEVSSFAEQVVYHHRATGTAAQSYLQAEFRAGQRDFTLGYHPAFMAVRTAGAVSSRGARGFVGGLAFAGGYLKAVVSRPPSSLPEEVRRSVRQEQKRRLKGLISGKDPVGRHTAADQPTNPIAPYGTVDTSAGRSDSGDGADKLRLLAVLGAGGHTTELLNLIDLLGDRYSYEYAVGSNDDLSVERIRRPGRVHRLHYPRGKTTHDAVTSVRTLYNGFQAFGLLVRHRPDAILSTGPSVALPSLILAKLLRIKVIFVETGSRIRTISVTGKVAYKVADLYFVQWPQLQERLPKAIYAGRLI